VESFQMISVISAIALFVAAIISAYTLRRGAPPAAPLENRNRDVQPSRYSGRSLMSNHPTDSSRRLVLNRLLAAPRAKIWRCWTEPDLLMQWFCPAPWKVTEAKMDVRPGGSNYFLMEGPEGQKFPNTGQYLELVKNERLVFSDAYIGDWQPSE